MANKKARVNQNVIGRFYVDDQCIACDNCVVDAPRFFAMNKIDGFAYVYNQPKLEAEIKICIEALNDCPVEAIGSDDE